MFTFMENQQLTRTNRHDTLASIFFRMTGDNFIVYASFSLRNRKDIHSFIKSLDQNKCKPIDIFFICQELNIKDQECKPTFFAVFTYFIGAIDHTKKALQAIISCKILQVTQMRVNELYQKMCQTSFIEINMFERLGKADFKIMKKTSNPFAQVYFYQDVSLFNNLDMAQRFISETLSQQKSLTQKMAKRKPINAQQKEYSHLLFGTITKDLIHLSPKDGQSLSKAYNQLQKYEIQYQQNFMRDEEQQFQDIEYREFDQQLQLQGEELGILMFLKKMRTDSIRGIREKLKDAERKRGREEICH